ncbi:MAG: RnfABCDGE type electron transport complex subunit D [Lachnospiraceae bacterium]|mgnify:CR=1 FL=1|nr:RnfABCDGE type electron transport complex subunit D [Lachnospiraceae bacterium]
MATLQISTSPHIHTPRTTRKIMLDVLIALAPAAIAGTIIFGLRSLLVIAACVISTVGSEYVFNLIMKRKQTIGDLSAAVTGLLLALNLPANVPVWQAVVGGIFAIIVVKCLFGGIGKNLVNPAITARVFMLVSFASCSVSAFPVADAVSTATPLVAAGAGNMPSILTLFLGTHGGAIGETCVLALLLGGIYLIVRGVITWHLPVVYVAAVFLFTFLLNGFDAANALSMVLSGGLMLGAIFMATDYVTSPSTAAGKAIFGVGAAVITVMIRFWGTYPEGTSFAILMMNILTPYIDSWTSHKLFGGAKA